MVFCLFERRGGDGFVKSGVLSEAVSAGRAFRFRALEREGPGSGGWVVGAAAKDVAAAESAASLAAERVTLEVMRSRSRSAPRQEGWKEIS